MVHDGVVSKKAVPPQSMVALRKVMSPEHGWIPWPAKLTLCDNSPLAAEGAGCAERLSILLEGSMCSYFSRHDYRSLVISPSILLILVTIGGSRLTFGAAPPLLLTHCSSRQNLQTTRWGGPVPWVALAKHYRTSFAHNLTPWVVHQHILQIIASYVENIKSNWIN